MKKTKYTLSVHSPTYHTFDMSLNYNITSDTSITRRVYQRKQELLSLREHICSPLNFGMVHVAHLFSFLWYVFRSYCHIVLVLLSCTRWFLCPWDIVYFMRGPYPPISHSLKFQNIGLNVLQSLWITYCCSRTDYGR